jgi:hypothetical protein
VSDALGARAEERDLLCGFLDWYRSVAVGKVEGLPLETASRVMTPTGLSPLGIVEHLAWAERNWFRWRFIGEDVYVRYGEDGTNTIQFALDPQDTVESVVAFYRDEIEHSRRIVGAAPSLDELSVSEHPIYGHVSLRWVLVHMLEETARHAGHLDLMREQIDGRTGD